MIRLAIATLENPDAVEAARAALQHTRPLAAEQSHDEAILLQASLVFAALEQTSGADVERLAEAFADPTSNPAGRRLAGEALRSLMATPHAGRALEIVMETLRKVDSPSHEPALHGLGGAARWARGLLDAEALLALAALEHLKPHRPYLTANVIEPALLGVERLTDEAEERWMSLYADAHEGDYIRYLRRGGDALPAAVRANYPLHAETATFLRNAPCRVLMVHNISHGQGDEIIRCVPLLQSLLDANPRMELTLITRRLHLYAHPRIELIRVDEAPRLEHLWRERYDVVIDFVHPFAPASSDSDLEEAVAALVRRSEPNLFLWATNTDNTFVFERIELRGRPWASALRLDRRRIENAYDTTFRLLAELGLPVRSGEAVPDSGWVLAAETWEHEESCWREITAGNHQRRPVVLLNPFGGADPLKGLVDAAGVAAEIGRLVAGRYYVIVLPNGTSWGTRALIAEAIARLPPGERQQVVIGPDAHDREAASRHTVHGLPPLSQGDYTTRLTLHWLRRADLTVSVEGWMIHAAYCLGRPYLALLLSYSEPDAWTPLAQSTAQRAVSTALARPWLGDAVDCLPQPPRKQLVLVLLDEIGKAGVDEALPLLRRSLRSPDRDLRRVAVRALVRYGDRVIEDLTALLQDASREVRAIAAAALLDAGLASPPVPVDELTAHVLMGRTPLDWKAVIGLGSSIRPVVEVARNGDEPPLRREAAIMLRFFDARRESEHGRSRAPTKELLYLSPVVPALAGNGLAMRAGMVLQALADHYRISLLVVRLYPSPETRIPSAFRRLCRQSTIVDPEPAGAAQARSGEVGAPAQLPESFRSVPFDTVHVFRLATAPYARRLFEAHPRRPRLDLDLDDVDSRTHRRLASLHRVNGESARAAFEERQAERADSAEREAFEWFDRVYVCSEDDRALIQARVTGEVGVLPNAVRPSTSASARSARGPFRILFVGTLGYYPNEDAVLHLCREIVPRLREPAGRLIEIDVVGGGASPRLREAASAAGVNLRGAVSRLARWYRRCSLVVTPIRAGGGTRIKIIEAWSHRRPVVSSTLGAEGLGARHEREVLLADDPERFSEACLRLLNDRGLADRLAESAHDLYLERYSAEAMHATIASLHRHR